MSVADFYTFLTGGIGLLIALLVIIAWTLWRMQGDARAGRPRRCPVSAMNCASICSAWSASWHRSSRTRPSAR
ncbi:hypothetical protein HC928_16565, partial [bacterium]|nr:hypothetical protein [bacterium]